MAKINVCVFGSSSSRTPDAMMKASEELGKLLAEQGHLCLNGGGRFGWGSSSVEGCASQMGVFSWRE